MNRYCLRFFYILALLYTIWVDDVHSHIMEVSIDAEECQIALLSHKETLSIFFEAIDQDNVNQLLAFRNNNLDIYKSYRNGQIFLHYASLLGKVETIHTLVSKIGVDVNIKDQNGKTALHHAVLNKDIESRISSIYTLIELGADVYALDNLGYKPSDYVAVDKDKHYYEYFLEQKEKLIKIAIKIGVGEIGKLFQINYSTLSQWVSFYKKENGLTIEKKSHYSPERRREAVELALRIGTLKAAKITKTPNRTIRGWVLLHEKGNKLVKKEPYYYAPEQRKEAVELALRVGTLKAAEITGIPDSTISNWVVWHKKENHIPTRRTYSQKEKEEVVRLAYEIGIRKAAMRVDISIRTAISWVFKDRKTKGLKVKRLRKYTQEEKNEIVELARRSPDKKKIAEKLGIHIRTLQDWIIADKRKKDMPIQTPPRYSQEYREKLVELALEVGTGKVLKDFTVYKGTLSRWVHQEKKKRGLLKSQPSYTIKEKNYAIDLSLRFGLNKTVQETSISRNTLSTWMDKLYKATRILESQKSLSYTPEQKEEAVRLAARGDMIRVVAENLNIPLDVLVSEVRKYEKEKKKQYLNYILKLEALKAVIEDGDSIEEVAEDFSITEELLTVWVEEYQEQQVKENENIVNSTLSMTVNVSNAAESDVGEQKIQKPVIKLYEEWDNLFLYPEELKQKAIQALKNDFDIEKVAEDFGISREVLMLFFREHIYSIK